MRGKVDVYDAATGVGVIVGVDSGRYRFSGSDLIAGAVATGQSVDFAAGDDGRASGVVAAAVQGTGRFDMGQVVQETFTTIGRHWGVFFGASVLMVGGPSLIYSISQVLMNSAEFGVIAAFVFAVSLLAYVAGYYLLQAAVMKVVVNGARGRPTSFGEALRPAGRKALPLVGLSVLSSLGIGLATILLIIPGIIVAVWWSVAGPVLVTENRGVTDSLSRSKDLTEGYRWPIFGLVAIYLVLTSLIAYGLGPLLGALGAFGPPGPGGVTVNVLVDPISNVLAGVVGAVGAAVLYSHLRRAKEGTGAEELAAVFD
jgi:hypothetical protein